MIDPIRSRIRGDVLAGYEEASPDLARRVLTAVRTEVPARRSAFPVIALTAALLLLGAIVVVVRGTHLLSLSNVASQGGLRPPVAPYSIVDNQFVSASTGWILIQMHVTSGPLVLLKTSDGGAHWVEQFRYSGAGSIENVQFSPNGRDGWMTWMEGGSTLAAPGQAIPASNADLHKTYVTHDGGTNWALVRIVSTPNPPKTAPKPEYWPEGQTFYLPDGLHGWQLRVPTDGTRPPLLMRTTDGGETWTQVATLPNGAEAGQLSFFDARTGWLSMNANRSFAWDAQGHRLPSINPPALLYVTHDGGATWTVPALPLPAAASSPDIVTGLQQPIMIDSSHGLLPLQLRSAPSPPNGNSQPTPGPAPANFVLKTSDGGDHWTDLTQVGGFPSDGNLIVITLDHWLTASGGLVSETTDGGKTWSTRRVLADGLTLSMAQWDLVKPNVIWAQVGAGSLVRSTDGGKTWTAVTPPTVH